MADIAYGAEPLSAEHWLEDLDPEDYPSEQHKALLAKYQELVGKAAENNCHKQNSFFKLMHNGLKFHAGPLGLDDLSPLAPDTDLNDLWMALHSGLEAARDDDSRAAKKVKAMHALLTELLDFKPPAAGRRSRRQKEKEKESDEEDETTKTKPKGGEQPKVTLELVKGALISMQQMADSKLPDMAKALGCPPDTADLASLARLIAAKPKALDLIGAAGLKLIKRTPPTTGTGKTETEKPDQKGDAAARAAAKGPDLVMTAMGMNIPSPFLAPCALAAEAFVAAFGPSQDTQDDRGTGALETVDLSDLPPPAPATGYPAGTRVVTKTLDTRALTMSPDDNATFSLACNLLADEVDALTGLSGTLLSHLAAKALDNFQAVCPRVTPDMQLPAWQALSKADLAKLAAAGLPLTSGSGTDSVAAVLASVRAAEAAARPRFSQGASSALGAQGIMAQEIFPRIINAVEASAARPMGIASSALPVRGLARVVTSAPYGFLFVKAMGLLAGGVALFRLDDRVRTAIVTSTYFPFHEPARGANPFSLGLAAAAAAPKRARSDRDEQTSDSDASSVTGPATSKPRGAQPKQRSQQHPQHQQQQKQGKAKKKAQPSPRPKFKVEAGAKTLWACLHPSTTRFTSPSDHFSRRTFAACGFCGNADCAAGELCGDEFPAPSKQRIAKKYYIQGRTAAEISELYATWCSKQAPAPEAGAAT